MGLVTGRAGFRITFVGMIPPELDGADPNLIRGFILGNVTMTAALMPHTKASTVELVEMGLDGKPRSGPAPSGLIGG